MLFFFMSCAGPEEDISMQQQDVDEPTQDGTDTVGQLPDSSQLNYLALGDSYTIGQSVDPSLRWPVLLVKALNKKGLNINPPEIIAQTGWTTNELQMAIDKEMPEAGYDLVSLLIGVNNQYRGYQFDQFETEFEALLKKAIELADGNEAHVIVLSIPDYSVTPFGQGGSSQEIAEAIDKYNAYKKQVCEQYEVSFFNVTTISRQAKDDPSLIARDDLHPSGKMYQLWVDEIIGDVRDKY